MLPSVGGEGPTPAHRAQSLRPLKTPCPPPRPHLLPLLPFCTPSNIRGLLCLWAFARAIFSGTHYCLLLPLCLTEPCSSFPAHPPIASSWSLPWCSSPSLCSHRRCPNPPFVILHSTPALGTCSLPGPVPGASGTARSSAHRPCLMSRIWDDDRGLLQAVSPLRLRSLRAGTQPHASRWLGPQARQ